MMTEGLLWLLSGVVFMWVFWFLCITLPCTPRTTGAVCSECGKWKNYALFVADPHEGGLCEECDDWIRFQVGLGPRRLK